LCVNLNVYTQNILLNPNFGSGGSTFDPCCGYGQLHEFCDNWQAAFDQPDIRTTTPDWYRNNSSPFIVKAYEYFDLNNYSLNQPIFPLSDEHYAGMLAGELIQQNVAISPGIYNLKFTFRISENNIFAVTDDPLDPIDAQTIFPWSGDSKLEFYVSDTPLDYIEAFACPDEEILKDNALKVYTEIVNLTKYPSGIWHTLDVNVTIPFTETMNWFGFHFDQCDGYMLVDNVSLELLEPFTYTDDCNTCLATDGTISPTITNKHTWDQQNSIFEPFSVSSIYNISEFRMEIFTITSQLVKDIQFGNPPNIVAWNGKNLIGNEAPDGNYQYRITLSNNCETNKQFTGVFPKVTFPSTGNIPGQMDYIPIENKIDILDQCCHSCIIIDGNSLLIDPLKVPIGSGANIIYFLKDGVFDITAYDKIQIGPNIGIDPTTELNLRAGAIIKYIDPNIIGSGVMQTAEIETCTYN